MFFDMMKFNKAFKRVNYLLSAAVTIGCLSACNGKTGVDNDADAVQIHYSGKADMYAASEFFSNRISIVTQSTPNAIVGQISRAVEVDSLLIVNDDRNQVMAFDMRNGTNVFAIHNVGQGPGEYNSLYDIAVDADRKELLLLADKKILIYDLAGVFTGREIPLDEYCNEIVVKDDKIYLAKETFANNTLAETQIAVLDYPSGRAVASYLQPLEEYAPYCTTQGRSLNLIESNGKKQILFTRKFDSRIYSLGEADAEPAYCIDWGETAFKPEENTTYDCAELAKLTLIKQLVYRVVNVQAGDSTICFSTNIPHIFIADRNALELKLYTGIVDDVLGVPLSEMVPISGSKGKVLFSLPYHLLAKYDSMMPEDEARRQLVESMDDDSNPLYIIYTLK